MVLPALRSTLAGTITSPGRETTERTEAQRREPHVGQRERGDQVRGRAEVELLDSELTWSDRFHPGSDGTHDLGPGVVVQIRVQERRIG